MSLPRTAVLLLLVACQNSKTQLPIEATVNPNIASIIHLAWEGSEDLSTYVRFGTEGNLSHQTPAVDGQSSVDLLGMPADTDVFFELVDAADDGVIGSGNLRNGTLPADYTPYTVDQPGKNPGWDGYLVSTSLASVSGPIILDNAGNIVWWWPDNADLITTSVTLSADGQSVWYITNPQTTVIETGELVRVAIDGSSEERFELPGVHHDFVEMPDGTITLLSQDTREWDGHADTVGDRLLNVAADGTYTEIWNIFDDWPDTPWDITHDEKSPNWSHSNKISYDANEDVWYLSFRNFDSIVKMDGASKQVLWHLGGDLSDFTFVDDPKGQFDKQHGFEVLPTGILVFDDGSPSRGWSRAVEYDLDETAKTATMVMDYRSDPLRQSLVLGDVERLENGNTIVGFSTAGQIDVVDSNEKLLWRLSASMGYAIGYLQHVDSLYR